MTIRRIYNYIKKWLAAIRYFPETQRALRETQRALREGKADLSEIFHLLMNLSQQVFFLRNMTKVIIRDMLLDTYLPELHTKSFSKFKDINRGRKLAIVGRGPSLTKFSPDQAPFMANAKYIGVNSAFRYEKILFDYLFIQDYHLDEVCERLFEDASDYRPGACEKFYGILLSGGGRDNIPAFEAEKAGAHRYYTDASTGDYFKDITTHPLTDFYSVIFSALSFAIFTNPAELYILGCDCSRDGHFDVKAAAPDDSPADELIIGWKKFAAFAKKEYPQTRIFSVNPVNLAGLFTDIYTEE